MCTTRFARDKPRVAKTQLEVPAQKLQWCVTMMKRSRTERTKRREVAGRKRVERGAKRVRRIRALDSCYHFSPSLSADVSLAPMHGGPTARAPIVL